MHTGKLVQVTNFTIVGGTASHCVDQNMVLFRYCSLGGDTAMPGGLRARLCYAFLVYLFFSRPNYRQVIPESAGSIFTKCARLVDVLEGFIKCLFILRLLKGVYHGNQFLDRIVETGRPHLHLTHWSFKTDYRIAILISIAMIPLRCIEI